MEGYQLGGRWERIGDKVQGLRSTNRQLQSSHGDVKCSRGSEVAKELTGMTQGQERWCGGCLRECWVEGDKRGKNQDNCNSIINKI